MISVLIPTLNAAGSLAGTLAALVPAAVDGVVSEVIVSDGGSTDATVEIADDAGARLIWGEAGRGRQLRRACEAAKGPWLLALHADTQLEPGWEVAAAEHVARRADQAGHFRFALDDGGVRARLWEAGVALRCRAFALPYGDQGLLISRTLYEAVGGYPAWPLMEDVAIARALGRARLRPLAARAITSAARFRRDGYLRRSLGNWALLGRYLAGASPERLARDYA